MVEELYIQDKIKNLIEKYQNRIQRITNTSEEFLEQNCILDEGSQEAVKCYREILQDLETLVVLDDPKTEASVEKSTKRTNKK